MSPPRARGTVAGGLLGYPAAPRGGSQGGPPARGGDGRRRRALVGGRAHRLPRRHRGAIRRWPPARDRVRQRARVLRGGGLRRPTAPHAHPRRHRATLSPVRRADRVLSTRTPEFSVVVPVYNEEDSVRPLVDE